MKITEEEYAENRRMNSGWKLSRWEIPKPNLSQDDLVNIIKLILFCATAVVVEMLLFGDRL